MLKNYFIVLAATSSAFAAKFGNPSFAEVTAGQPFNITWFDASGSVTITLKNGPATALKDVTTIASGLSGTSFSWVPPSSLTDGPYALEITDSTGPNFSVQFPINGVSAASSSISSTLSTTPTSASSATLTASISTPSASSHKSASSTSTASTTNTSTTSSTNSAKSTSNATTTQATRSSSASSTARATSSTNAAVQKGSNAVTLSLLTIFVVAALGNI